MELKKYKLGEILDVTRGASLSGEYYATDGKYIRLTCGNFDYQNNCFKENTSKDNLYYVGDFKPEYLMEEGDIITPLTEQAIGLLGSTAFIPESGKYIQSQDVAKITCKEDSLDKNFAYYLISSAIVKQQLSAAAQQTKIRHTSPDKIKDCTVWIPCLSDQKKIGSLLRSIDRKIELNRAINRNLEAMAKQLYDYWFVQFDFPNEDGKPYKSSGGEMVYNKALNRYIPLGWNVKSIGEIAEVQRGSIITAADAKNGDVKVVAAALDFAYYHDTPNRSENIITVSCSGANAGYINYWREAIYASDCTTVQCKDVTDTLICLYGLKLHQQRLMQSAQGSAQPHVYPKQIAELPVVCPPASLRNQMSKILPSINSQIGNNLKEIEGLAKQRDELLPLLMNGQVKVNCDLSHG